MNDKEIIGIVLAGGRSSRMGQDKALLEWNGVSLLEHMRRLLLEAGVDRVVVSGERPGFDCVPDAEPGQGPGAALSGVLAALPAQSWALVVPVDMPLLKAPLLRSLIVQARPAHFASYPLPAFLPASVESLGVPAGDSVRALHRLAGSVALALDPADEAGFANVNTPEEWRQAEGGRMS